jgi:hypothetical protein
VKSPPRVPPAESRSGDLLWYKQGALTTALSHKSLPPPVWNYQWVKPIKILTHLVHCIHQIDSRNIWANTLCVPCPLSITWMFSLHNGDALVLSPSSPLTQHLRETHMRPHDLWFSVPTIRVATEMTIFTKTYTNIKLRVSKTFDYVRENNNTWKYFVKCWKCVFLTNFSEENGSELICIS